MSKAYKRNRRLKSIGSMLYMLLISLLVLPLAFVMQKLWRKPSIDPSSFFGMSVNYDKAPQQTLAFIQELGVKNLLIRFRMDEISQLDDFVTWLKQFKEYDIIINLIQNPNLQHQELSHNFETTLTALYPLTHRFQIGTTINRSKWGFYSVHEYLRFFRQAHKLRKKFSGIELYGPSVIDFEYHYTTQALFNPFTLRYDGCSSLLYVDRTITPENKQFGFNLIGKIDLLYSLVKLSPKTQNRILITETNWPIKGSGEYAPTSDLECVTEEDFANYLIRYYLLALGSSKVESVYWHQMIAVGFGLINPLKDFEKRSAFDAFKTMYTELHNATDIKLLQHQDYFELQYRNASHEAKLLWTNNIDVHYEVDDVVSYLTRDGKKQTATHLTLTGKPIYLMTKELT